MPPRREKSSAFPLLLIPIGFLGVVALGSFAVEYTANEPPTVSSGKKAPPAVAAVTPKSPPTQKAIEPPPEMSPPTEPRRPEPKPQTPASKKSTTPTTAKSTDPKPPAKPPEPKPPEPKKPDPKATTPVLFAKVRPIFADKCFSCHGAASKKADLDLQTLASIAKGSNGGLIVKAGDIEKSQLWLSIVDDAMPPDGKTKLTADEKKLIKDWIASGAK